MASPALPVATIAALPSTIWADEPLSNAVWSGILSSIFTGSPAPAAAGAPANPTHIIAPEGRSSGSRPLRADLMVWRLPMPFTATSQKNPVLHFEGKNSGGQPDQIRGQIDQYMANAGRAWARFGNIWAIGTAGSNWRPYIYNGTTLQDVTCEINATGALQVRRKRSQPDTWYDITESTTPPAPAPPTYPGYARLAAFLQFVYSNPHPTTASIPEVA